MKPIKLTEGANIKESAKILIVDDQETNCKVLRRSLSLAGFEVETATRGNEALQKIQLLRFDLVLLDIHMPDMSGIEVLASIRKSQTLIELPVLMVTAETQTEHMVEAFELGANDYLTKPLDLKIVLARTKTHIALKKTEERVIAALKKEKELAVLKTQFLTMASHEFRTPLTAIMSASDVLKRYISRMQEEERNESLNAIQTQVKVLTNLLDEFMIFAEESEAKPALNLE